MTAEEQSAIRQLLQDEAQARNETVRNNKAVQQKTAQKKEAVIQRSRKQNSKPASVSAKDKRLAAAVKRGKLLNDPISDPIDLSRLHSRHHQRILYGRFTKLFSDCY